MTEIAWLPRQRFVSASLSLSFGLDSARLGSEADEGSGAGGERDGDIELQGESGLRGCKKRAWAVEGTEEDPGERPLFLACPALFRSLGAYIC